ncbi:hypothetical protein C4588_05680 [Candidatus Parcubacteria bacterium]|nr:MAG: hypothetical protein C4588_05680 [Candidatus Parcubacteria bacterium]
MNTEDANTRHIIQLNENIRILDKNVQFLENSIKTLAKDIAAMQRAIIEYMAEKDLISSDEDRQLFQKLHLRNIARIDQETAKLRDQHDIME